MTLTQFTDNLPPGVDLNTDSGTLVFGMRDVDSLPYRVAPGQMRVVKAEDVGLLPIVTQFFSRVFDLTNHEQCREYEQIRNAIVKNWFALVGEPSFYWHTEDGQLKRYVHIEYVSRERILTNHESKL
jgi:hypothetical protein